MGVIIEGVETEAQRRFLHELGATRFQGYLASAPVDAAAFKQLLRRLAGLLPDPAITLHSRTFRYTVRLNPEGNKGDDPSLTVSLV